MVDIRARWTSLQRFAPDTSFDTEVSVASVKLAGPPGGFVPSSRAMQELSSDSVATRLAFVASLADFAVSSGPSGHSGIRGSWSSFDQSPRNHPHGLHFSFEATPCSAGCGPREPKLTSFSSFLSWDSSSACPSTAPTNLQPVQETEASLATLVPPTVDVPSSWFLTTSTGSSAGWPSGLLRPEHGHGVHCVASRALRVPAS